MAAFKETILAKAAGAASFNAEARTVDVLFYTGAFVDRYRYTSSGFEKYMLGFDMDAIDASRFEKGVGLFLDHYTTVDNQIGHSVPGTLKKTDAGYVVTFALEDISEFPPENRVRRAVEKLISQQANEFSMGVDWDDQTEEKKNGMTYITAKNWQPYEISLVGVDADHGTASLHKREGNMPGTNNDAGQVAPDNSEELRREGAKQERERAQSIEMLGKKFGMADLAAKHVKDGTAADVAREEILAAVQAKIEAGNGTAAQPSALPGSTTPSVQMGADAVDKTRDGIVQALAAQFGGKKVEGNEFSGMKMSAMAMRLAEVRGEKFRDAAHLKAAIMNGGNSRLALTPSDFPVIIGEAANVYLLGQGVVESQAFEAIGTREDLPDMNAVKGVDTVFDVAVTKALAPGEKYPDAKMSESSETYRLEKKGAFLRITEEVLDAERVGAIANGINQGAFFFRRLESQTFYAGLFGTDGLGPTMTSDSKKFFHADHNNLASARKFDATGVAELITKLRKQKKGSMSLNLPAFGLVVPAALEIEAGLLVKGDFTSNTVAAAKLPVIRGLQVIVDSAMDDITSTGYAVITDPRLITIVNYGWKIGEEGVQLMSPVWDDEDDTWRYKFKDRFGVAAMGYCGAAFNPGASS